MFVNYIKHRNAFMQRNMLLDGRSGGRHNFKTGKLQCVNYICGRGTGGITFIIVTNIFWDIYYAGGRTTDSSKIFK